MGRRKIPWDDTTIMDAVERFREEFGRDPTSHDFMELEYLPDPQTIRKLYGGLPAFRKKFGFLVEDYTKGDSRSKLAKTLNDRAKADEDKIDTLLVNIFGEICVHKEREFAYRNRVDFQVYHSDGVFGVDTFYPKNRYALMNIFNIKFAKYKNFSLGPVYLVSMNSELSQDVLDFYMKNRKNEVHDNIFLLSEDSFVKMLSQYKKRTKL